MDYLPVFLAIENQPCLVVGGGEVAFRKVRILARAGASVHLVARDIATDLQLFLENHGLTFRQGEFSKPDLEGCSLVIAATDDALLNEQVSRLARAKFIPVNVVDQPELCTFIFPAIIDRNPLLVAISSSGTSPVLARQIKTQLETLLPASLGKLATFLGGYRKHIRDRIPDFTDRLRFWERLIDSNVQILVGTDDIPAAKALVEDMLDTLGGETSQGEVYLVGAGPGDPELLTLKALRLMHSADVVVHDRLVSDAILQKIRPDAELIYVGKQRASHSVPQENINDMLVRLAREGRRVLRLKGGDPFIFGRGGEEMESLIQEGVPFQIVPGITAASGCACYAGIPLTHRDYAHSVQFLTGHFSNEDEEPDWSVLSRPGQTLVFYMGLVNLGIICNRLVAAGRDAATPAALIQKGTTVDHKVVKGDLSTLAENVGKAGIVAPTLLIIGEVVDLSDSLSWYKPAAE